MLLNCRLVAFEPEVTGVVITATREIDGEALAALEPVLGKKVFAVG